MPKNLPSLEYLREHYSFDLDGTVRLRKKTHRSDFRKVGDHVGSQMNTGYLTLRVKKIPYLLHRLVYYHFYGWCPETLDHRDGNKQNNNPDNLRPASQSENVTNTKKRTFRGKSTTSEKKGVHWHKRQKKWNARIRHQGKLIHLGTFSSEDEAYQAYLQASKKYHGDFARG